MAGLICTAIHEVNKKWGQVGNPGHLTASFVNTLVSMPEVSVFS